MKYKGLRIAIGVITGFIALTAIGGGIALLSGAEGYKIPVGVASRYSIQRLHNSSTFINHCCRW